MRGGSTVKVKELGHVVLYVRDIGRSRRFYGEILGWPEVGDIPLGVPVAAFTSGRTHHELLLIQVGDDAAPVPPGRRLGLYHIGLKVGDSDDELRAVLSHIRAAGVELVGSSDHTVTHSLYVLDPDGNEIELYVDVPDVDWSDPGTVMSPVRPLRI
jgi:catechol 2,3-dioxygenase